MEIGVLGALAADDVEKRELKPDRGSVFITIPVQLLFLCARDPAKKSFLVVKSFARKKKQVSVFCHEGRLK